MHICCIQRRYVKTHARTERGRRQRITTVLHSCDTGTIRHMDNNEFVTN